MTIYSWNLPLSNNYISLCSGIVNSDVARRELHYQAYEVGGNPDILFRPFVNIYFGAAYLISLSNFDQK